MHGRVGIYGGFGFGKGPEVRALTHFPVSTSQPRPAGTTVMEAKWSDVDLVALNVTNPAPRLAGTQCVGLPPLCATNTSRAFTGVDSAGRKPIPMSAQCWGWRSSYRTIKKPPIPVVSAIAATTTAQTRSLTYAGPVAPGASNDENSQAATNAQTEKRFGNIVDQYDFRRAEPVPRRHTSAAP